MISTLRLKDQRVSEVAHLRHFLTGTILFSSIYPTYEENLKEELFACFKYIGIPFDVLDKMSIRDRKFYIQRYNRYMEEREEAMNNEKGSSSTYDIGMYTNLSQGMSGSEAMDF